MQMMRGEKAKDFGGAVKKLAGYLSQYKLVIIAVWVMAIISTILSIFGPKIQAEATDVLVSGLSSQISGMGSIDFTQRGEILLRVAGLYAFSALFSYAQGFLMSGVTMKVTYRLRTEIDEKIHKLPFRYFDKVTHGEVLSRITNDVDTISQTLNQNLTQIITSVTSLLGIAAMMLTISWQLTLASFIILPLSGVIIAVIVKKSQKYFLGQQKYLGHVNGHIEEMFSSHTVVKAFNGEHNSLGKFDEYNDSLYDSAWKAHFLSGLMMPIMFFIGNIGYVVICILGGYYAANALLTVGGIQSFIQYVRQFNQPIMQVANISNTLQQTAAAAERVFEFLTEEEETPEATGALDVKTGSLNALNHISGAVSFNNVAFGYKPDNIIIHDFNAQIEPGQKIAIVGPTGAGKTTIVKLLMRFYDVNSGSIKVEGHDIKSFKRDSLRSLFGMVLQDTWLFNGTIADNIRYGRLSATDEEVYAAAKAAQVDHFVRTLPEGYNLVLNEEANNISQGQKQLLTIARAILANPEILILDEATSSVDTRTEALIQRAMGNLMKGRTCFIIAHRLSTIRDADLILVMRGGDIVEKGAHGDLLKANGFYASLYFSQFAAKETA
jgi:ATP-binding cassette subfamily B protein